MRSSNDLFQIAQEVFTLFAEYAHIRSKSENQVFAAANSRSSLRLIVLGLHDRATASSIETVFAIVCCVRVYISHCSKVKFFYFGFFPPLAR